MLARYNRVANERLYASCGQLGAAEYRKERAGSFRSIHALLNHILLGDWIWMERFEGNSGGTPPLDTILFEDFAGLRLARVDEDARIETFFASLPEDFLSHSVTSTIRERSIQKRRWSRRRISLTIRRTTADRFM